MTRSSGQGSERARPSGGPASDDAGTRSLGEITSDLTRDFSDLVRAEMALAKAEVRQEAKAAGKAGVIGVGAAMLAWLTLLLLAMSVGFLLANAIGDDPPAFALGFFLAGLLFAVPAAVAGVLARKRLQTIDPVPRRTAESVSADVQAVKERRA